MGENAKDSGFRIGDKVSGFVRGGFVEKDNGAFQGGWFSCCKVFLLRHAMAHRVRQYAASIDLAHPRLVAV